MIGEGSRQNLSWNELENALDDLDASFEAFRPEAGQKVNLLSMGTESLIAMAKTRAEQLTVDTKDIDFYAEMSAGRSSTNIDNVDEDGGPVLKMTVSSLKHEDGEDFLAELARQPRNFGDMFNDEEQYERFTEEVQNGEVVYEGENIAVRAPSTEIYADKTIKGGAKDIDPKNRYKRSKQVETLNEVTGTDYDKWQVFPHRETVSGSWWGEFDGEEDTFEEVFQSSLDNTTDGRYSIEDDDECYLITDENGQTVATVAAKNNKDDLIGFNIQAGRRNTAERDVKYRELAVIERAMTETIESYGETPNTTKMNYEIDGSHKHDGDPEMPGGMAFGF